MLLQAIDLFFIDEFRQVVSVIEIGLNVLNVSIAEHVFDLIFFFLISESENKNQFQIRNHVNCCSNAYRYDA